MGLRAYSFLGIVAIVALIFWFYGGIAVSGDKAEQKAEAVADKVEKDRKSVV